MKVLHVSSGLDPRGGGTTTALAGMAQAQHEAGLDVRVLATHAREFDHATAEHLTEQGISVTLIGPTRTPLGLHPRIDPQLQPAIEAADVVHIHALWEQVQHRAARLALARRTPYLISPHGMLDPWSLAQSRFRKRFFLTLRLRHNLDHATALHFTTETECDMTCSLRLEAPAIVEPLGIDLDEFTQLPAPGAFRQAQPTIGHAPLILFLGRVHPGKGLEYLIPAMQHVTPADARLVIVGPGSEQHVRTMHELVRTLGLEDRVIFTGMLTGKDRLAAFVDADVFCLPSDHENFGVAVVEALACGTPVIVSDQVSLCREIAKHSVGEIALRDPEPLAAVLTRWLADDTRRATAATKAQSFAQTHYDWRQIGRRWVGHYQALVQSAAAPSPASP